MIAFLNWLDGVLWGVPLIALMILTGLYFTVRSGFFQFRHFGWIMKRTGGKLFQKEDKASEGKGMLSSFEAISTAIGGTVGFGNIAGVATAVAAGGPGAIMWMWLSSLLGMILKQGMEIGSILRNRCQAIVDLIKEGRNRLITLIFNGNTGVFTERHREIAVETTGRIDSNRD